MDPTANCNWRGLDLLVTGLLWISSSALPAATHTWTGSSGGLWSNPSNWAEGAPQPGEAPPVDLIIPSTAAGFKELTNDIPGLIVRQLIIEAHANTLHASPGTVLRLQNGLLVGSSVGTILETSFRLELDGTNLLQGSGELVVRGPLTESQPGATLHVSRSVRLETSSTHSGPTYLTNGTFVLYGPLTNATFLEVATNAQLTLAGDFSVLTNHGRLDVLPESHSRPQTSRLFGRGLVCAPGSSTSVAMIDYPALDSNDPADGGRLHSHLVIDGPMVLAGTIEASTDLSQAGLRFVIFENVGGWPTLGEFERVPEGALMRVQHAGLLTQRISYRGGAGKDVTARFVQPPAERLIAGPFLLENGWIQLLSGIAEFEDQWSHRWEANNDLANTNGWTAVGPDFIPAEAGTLLTITNADAFSQRFFRLAVP